MIRKIWDEKYVTSNMNIVRFKIINMNGNDIAIINGSAYSIVAKGSKPCDFCKLYYVGCHGVIRLVRTWTEYDYLCAHYYDIGKELGRDDYHMGIFVEPKFNGLDSLYISRWIIHENNRGI